MSEKYRQHRGGQVMEYRCKSSGKCSRGKACCYSCRYKRDCSEMVPCFSDPKICGHAVEKTDAGKRTISK